LHIDMSAATTVASPTARERPSQVGGALTRHSATSQFPLLKRHLIERPDDHRAARGAGATLQEVADGPLSAVSTVLGWVGVEVGAGEAAAGGLQALCAPVNSIQCLLRCCLLAAPDGSPAIPHKSRVKVKLQSWGDWWVDRVPAWIKYATIPEGEMGAKYNGVHWDPPRGERHVW
jgi:hypothetical protein